MADLDEIAASLNVQLTTHNKTSADNSSTRTHGQRRRTWLSNESAQSDEDESKGVNRPLKEDVPTETPDKLNPSTLSTNHVDSQKGSIKGVYRPLNLFLEDLRGNPLKITQYLFQLSKHTATRITEKVTLSEIMSTLVISKDSARTGLRFLLRNKLVERTDFRAGKGGWSKYKLKNELFNELELVYEKGSIDPFEAT